MLVHNEYIKNRILKTWLPKYLFNNFKYFKVLTFENDNLFLENRFEILHEKENNLNFINSNTELSTLITKEILKNQIELLFKSNNFQEIDINDFDKIKWDFKKFYKV